jgi:phosphate transport system substrate-binding protein
MTLQALLVRFAGASLLASQVAMPARPSLASGPGEQQGIRVGGSSTVFPILQESIRRYRNEGRQGSIRLTESGTTDGFRQFCQGKLAIANASRPISSGELKACARNGVTFIELPIAFDALTVVVNRSNDWAKLITVKELARLWGKEAQGRIDRWQQVNIDWPNQPIKLCGPGADSGTFEYFNKAINGSPAHARRDFTASEDDTVIARCVMENPRALGYFGYAYYRANASRLRPLTIVGPKGPVAPSAEAVQSGRYVPLSRLLFLYVNDRDLRQRSDVRSFITHTVRNGLQLVAKAGYIPLSASTYRVVESKLYRHILGTSFGGDLPVGLPVGEALRRSIDQTRKPQFR